MLTLITFLIVLSILVFVHELGHFVSARKFGIKAEEFGFGFPPRIWGIYKSDQGKWKTVWGSKKVEDAQDTVYSANLIPLGGFVKIKGEDGESLDKDSFAQKKIWQRTIVLSAGVFMNVMLAAVLISIGMMIGSPQALDNLGKKAVVTNRQIQVIQVMEDSPAKQAGFTMGDVILEVNGQKFENYKGIQEFVNQNVGKELTYKIKRGSGTETLKVTPELRQETGRGGIGIALDETGIVKYPWYMAIWYGFKQTAILTWVIIVAFFELIKNLLIGQGVSGDVAGPVGIAKLTGQVAKLGLVYILQFTSLLSINLAVINFLPFPALDGGRVFFLLIEKIKGKPVRREVEAVIHNIGFILLMILVIIVTFRDILKIW